MRKLVSIVLLLIMLALGAPQSAVQAWQCPYYHGCGTSNSVIFDSIEYCDTDACCYDGAPITYSCYHLNGFCQDSNLYFEYSACLETECEWCPLQ